MTPTTTRIVGAVLLAVPAASAWLVLSHDSKTHTASLAMMHRHVAEVVTANAPVNAQQITMIWMNGGSGPTAYSFRMPASRQAERAA